MAEWVRHQTKKQWVAGLNPTQDPIFLQIKIQIENANHIDSIQYQLKHRSVSIVLMTYRPNLRHYSVIDHYHHQQYVQ